MKLRHLLRLRAYVKGMDDNEMLCDLKLVELCEMDPKRHAKEPGS